MKKIYFLLLGGCVALSANAEKKEFGGMPAELHSAAFVQSMNIKSGSGFSAAPEKAERTTATPIEKLEKVNLWAFYSLLREDYGTQSESMYITIKDAATGAVGLHLGPYIPELAATFNPETGELSIPNLQYLFDDYDGPVYFYIKDIDEKDDLADGASDKDASTAVYESGFLSFDPDEVWAIGNPDNEEASWYTLCMSNEFSSVTPLGDGSFVENIIYPLFADGKENTKTLSATVRMLDDGIISVLDPFRATYELKGYTSKSPSMILDITDPANVLVQMQTTGLGNEEDGTLYYFSDSWYLGESPADDTEDTYIPIVMFREGGDVRITFPKNSMTLYGGVSKKFYAASAFESVLKFKMDEAGVEGVSAETTTAPVEYYTLQGLRVAQPGHGIFIRRAGSKTSKILIK